MANNKKGNTRKTATTKKVEKEVKPIEEPIVETPMEEETVKELEVANGDASVLTPIEEIMEANNEEMVSEPIEESAEEDVPQVENNKENKVSRVIDDMFGYSWNGQEMDY